MTHRRVEACDSWRPPPAPAQAPALLLRAGGPWGRSSSPPCAFASLSVRDGGEAMVVKAEEEREREMAAEGSGKKDKVPPVAQLLKHPLALLVLVPSSVALFAAGAGAGAVAKTVTAPLDRVKILMQACCRLLIPMHPLGSCCFCLGGLDA
ncbi:hypothetical protein ACQ4PT_069582 [Festuca glaucescens]